MTVSRGELAERAAHLPRDTRDTLFHLAVIAWAVAPHLLHLPPWCGVMTAALLLWRGRLALHGGALPKRWVVSGLLVVAAALTVWGERTLLGKEAGITMLVVLMALKTLELRARRDALVVFFLGFFLVLTHFLYSQSLATGLWLLVAVWGLLTALVLAHMPVGKPPLRRAAAVSARTAAWGMPLMVALFVLFPRIGPLWGLPQDAQGRTGLSGSMRLGGVASIAEDDSVALRIRFMGPVPRPEQMYFRGPVLSTFDGREWTRLMPTVSAALRPRLDIEVSGVPLRYEMTIEPSKLPLLPLLEMTPDRADSAPALPGWLLTLRPDGQWQADRPLVERVRVESSAWLQHRHGPRSGVPGLRDLTALPAGANPRTVLWAMRLREQPELAQADAPQLASAVLRHIASAGYIYTLEPGPYDQDAIDEFWLDRKLGFCEHFASAFVVVMRAMGVPARIVTGYQGTDAEPQDGYWIVRQRNAHAWAEIWHAGIGWVRVDPTAAVAPDRVQRGRSLRAPPGLVAGAFNSIDPALCCAHARLVGRRQQPLEPVGAELFSWPAVRSSAPAGLCSAELGGPGQAVDVAAGWRGVGRRGLGLVGPPAPDPWLRLQQRVQLRLAALGVEVAPHHAPRERSLRVRQQLGERGEAAAAQLEALDRQRYGSGDWTTTAGASWWRGFVRALKPP
jgi:hypothetical protein